MRLVRDDDAVQEEVDVTDPMELRDRAAEPGDGPLDERPEDALDAEDSTAELDVDLGVLEALLFSTHHPLTAGRLAELIEAPTTRVVRQAIKRLNEQYELGGRSFRVEQVAGGYQLLTLPEYGEHLQRLTQREADAKLTKAAMETLAIIAYRQPILRADVEAIRGVACGETIRSLMEKRLVKIAGRAEEPGRPILYGTTKRFLEVFGLNSTKDLPQLEEAFAKQPQAPSVSESEEAPIETPPIETPPIEALTIAQAPPIEAPADSSATEAPSPPPQAP